MYSNLGLIDLKISEKDEKTGEDSLLPFGLLILTLMILCTTIVFHERRQKAQSEASLERALS